MYEYSGAIHIHSVYSDGTGTIDEIAEAASRSGLDFIIMTDHNTLKPKEDGYDRWINDVLVMIGYELNDMSDKNHLLVFGMNELIGTFQPIGNGDTGCTLPASEYLKQINEKGGICFIAHPDEERKEGEHVAYPWTEWELDNYDGIEIWNHMSEWVEGMKKNNKLHRVLHPLKTIKCPPEKTLKRWDELSLKRQISPIGSVDAHAFRQNVMGFLDIEIFPYKVLFRSIRTNVILNTPLHKRNHSKYGDDTKLILEALKHGRCYISNYYYGSSKGFRYFAEFKGKFFNQGDTITKSTNDKVLLKTLVPKVCEIRLIHNGNNVKEINAQNCEWEVTAPGVYRIECWKNKYGWIFSNHIRILNEE